MKVRCIATGINCMTKGNVYKALEEYKGFIRVKNDLGQLLYYHRSCFEEVVSDEITDLQTANAQLTDRVSALEKDVKDIKKRNKPLFTVEQVTPEVFKSIFGDPFNFKKPTIKESLKVEKDSKKEFWEYVLINDDPYCCRGMKSESYCKKECPYRQTLIKSICLLEDIKFDTVMMRDRARKELGLEEKEKKLYLAVDSGDLNICYGTKSDARSGWLWFIDSEDGLIKTNSILPELWTEWQENGCKFDPEPVKWKGMVDEKEYRLSKDSRGVTSLESNWFIFNLDYRVPQARCRDKNILTDSSGRAFIV